jgi:hypothetical protein
MNYWTLSSAIYKALQELDHRDDDVICARIDELDSMVKTEKIKALFSGLGIDDKTLEIVSESPDFQVIAANAVRDLVQQIARHERAREIVEHKEAA